MFSISLAYQFGWLCRQLFLSYNFYVYVSMFYLYYIDSLHRVKYFKPLFLEIVMIMAYR